METETKGRLAERSTPRLPRGRSAFTILALFGQAARRECSSNGTRITGDGGHELILRRDEVTLWGHGWISFGPPIRDDAERVEFSYVRLAGPSGLLAAQ